VLLTVARALPDDPSLKGAMALNVSSPSSDVGMMFRYFAVANSAHRSNWEQWKGRQVRGGDQDARGSDRRRPRFRSTSPLRTSGCRQSAVAFIVHDLNRERSAKRQGFRLAAILVVDLTLVSLR